MGKGKRREERKARLEQRQRGERPLRVVEGGLKQRPEYLAQMQAWYAAGAPACLPKGVATRPLE